MCTNLCTSECCIFCLFEWVLTATAVPECKQTHRQYSSPFYILFIAGCWLQQSAWLIYGSIGPWYLLKKTDAAAVHCWLLTLRNLHDHWSLSSWFSMNRERWLPVTTLCSSRAHWSAGLWRREWLNSVLSGALRSWASSRLGILADPYIIVGIYGEPKAALLSQPTVGFGPLSDESKLKEYRTKCTPVTHKKYDQKSFGQTSPF